MATVSSKVLGATVVFAPKVPAGGKIDGHQVYTWREGFIIAKAQPAPELLLMLHNIKTVFGGAELQAIDLTKGKTRDALVLK